MTALTGRYDSIEVFLGGKWYIESETRYFPTLDDCEKINDR